MPVSVPNSLAKAITFSFVVTEAQPAAHQAAISAAVFFVIISK